MVFVEGFYYGVKVVGEVFHGSAPGGSAGLALAHKGGLDATIGGREVALGIVAHHKDLVRLEPHHLKLFKIIGGIGACSGWCFPCA